jgi:hypothetical protein
MHHSDLEASASLCVTSSDSHLSLTLIGQQVRPAGVPCVIARLAVYSRHWSVQTSWVVDEDMMRQDGKLPLLANGLACQMLVALLDASHGLSGVHRQGSAVHE